jgi:hypothetical protein
MKRRILLFHLFAFAAWSQNAGIQGIVTDSSKAIVVGASVTVTNIETGVALRAASNETGAFLFPSLAPGRYRIECTAPGFAQQQVNEIRLEVNQLARLDFELKPGAVTESIQVSAAAVLINSETTEVGQVIDSKRILEMPLNGRNYLSLAQFTAGALPGGGQGTGARSRDEGQFSAVGMQMAQNNVLLDGNDNSSRTSGGPLGFEAQQVKPPVDAVAEFKVVTNNMSAEYGYRAGAKVIVTSKSGSNEFHGSLYEFLRNDALDGTNFFANRVGARKPKYRQHQFGASLGGPVIKNKTFFFGSWQRTNIRFGQSFTSTVPSRDIIERGDFSRQPAVRRNVFDPATLTGTGAAAVRAPFPGNVIPQSRWDPVTAAVVKEYPASNFAGRDDLPDNYFFSPTDRNDADQFDFRGDHNFSDRHRFFARYSLRDQYRFDHGLLPFPAAGGLGQTVRMMAHNVASALSSSLTPSMFNELRFGFSQFNTAFDIPFTENLNPRFGIRNAPGDGFGDGLDHGWTRFSPGGFVEIGSRSFWPNINNMNNWMVTNSLLWQKGRHTIRVGGEYRNLRVYRDASRLRRGHVAFSGQFTAQRPNLGPSRATTGNGMADMLLGMVSGGSFGNNQGEDILAPYYGLFIQDDWKVNSRLTINIGLRYEKFFMGTFPNPEAQTVSRYLTTPYNVASRAEERIVFPGGGGDCGCANDRNNFAPRLGIAWSVTSKTVIRTGGGIFYGEPNSLSTEGANFRTGAPRHAEIAILQNFETTNFLMQNGFPAFTTAVIQRGVPMFAFPNRRDNLMAKQWYFDLQRTLPFDTLLTVGYVGTKGTHLAVQRNINLPVTPSATVPAVMRLIRPEFSNVWWHDNMTHSSYHAFTAKVEKRFAKGLTYLAAFTWSRNMDQGNEDLFDGGQGPQTPYDLRRERARSNLDRTLGFISSVIYELPFGRGKSYLTSGPGSWLFGGWQIGGIVSLHSGFPIPHTIAANNENLGGAVRGDFVRNPNLPPEVRTIDRWFDPDFVVPSAPGVPSNAGRNLILAPGRRNLDVMVARNFAMPWEGHQLQFRFESFNFTNTANFGRPVTTVLSPAVGRIASAEDPRRIQFALRYVF